MKKFKMLKKCLLGLFLGLFGLLSFGYCDTVYSWLPSNGSVQVTKPGVYGYFSGGTCVATQRNSNACLSSLAFYNMSGDLVQQGWRSDNSYSAWLINCFDFDGYMSLDNHSNDTTCYYTFYNSLNFPFNQECPDCPVCQECPEVDTGAILSGSCDTNYCVENDLCPSLTGSWSELKINNIVHEGKPFINISIPDYIFWDYSTDTNQFDLYVGSGYDQDYIDSVLAINSYRPDNEDFTNIFVSGLTLIFPYIFVALLIVFMWKLLKRIFK